ncbi:MAG TPA: VOC family protein [Nitrospiraceae bacterium]|jgi:uncharacterized glyoxalase superfamily protein PhnB
MTTKPIPAGFHTVTPYLVTADASRVIEFLKEAFDAKELHRLPAPDGRVLHAEIQIGDSIIMMGEASGDWKAMPASFAIYVDNADATYERAITAGAISLREPANQFYGDRSGGVRDLAGNHWWIATHLEDVAPSELQARAEKWMKDKAQVHTQAST